MIGNVVGVLSGSLKELPKSVVTELLLGSPKSGQVV
jgi:hypothetical protein